MKVRPVGAELLHADGLTDKQTDADRRGEATIRFTQFCEPALKANELLRCLGNSRFWFRDQYLLTYSMEQNLS